MKLDKKTQIKEWHINTLQSSLGDKVCYLLPIIQSIGGCDTTSRLYGIGKGVPLKKARADALFALLLEQMLNYSTYEELKRVGEKVLVQLYGGKKTESFEALRIRKFKDNVVKCTTCVEIQNLPPTLDARRYHTYRAFYQAKCWMSNDEDCSLREKDYGWQNLQGKLLPRTMDCEPAPDYILKLIHCQCKGDCSTARCSCKKHYLKWHKCLW